MSPVGHATHVAAAKPIGRHETDICPFCTVEPVGIALMQSYPQLDELATVAAAGFSACWWHEDELVYGGDRAPHRDLPGRPARIGRGSAANRGAAAAPQAPVLEAGLFQGRAPRPFGWMRLPANPTNVRVCGRRLLVTKRGRRPLLARSRGRMAPYPPLQGLHAF